MKRILILGLLFAGISASSQSLHFGLKGGANITNFTGGDFGTIKNKAIVAFHGGGYLNIQFAGLSVQPEVLISSQGSKLEDAGNTETWKATYIAVPVMLKFKPSGNFYLEAGPQVSFKISEDIGNQTFNEFAKDLDLSIGAGLGIQGKSGFGLGARYMAGLSKVGDFTSSSIDPDFKNGVLQISLMIGLGGGK